MEVSGEIFKNLQLGTPTIFGKGYLFCTISVRLSLAGLILLVVRHKCLSTVFFKGEKIYVFDDLFPKDLLDHMRAHVLKYGTYFYDDSIDEESDNVQWIAGLDMPLFLKSPYWKIISAVSCMLFCILMVSL